MPETSEEGETLPIGFPGCVGSINMVSVRVVLKMTLSEMVSESKMTL